MADSARPFIKLNDAVKTESCHDPLLHPSLCLGPFAANPVILSETSEHKGGAVADRQRSTQSHLCSGVFQVTQSPSD